MGKLVIVVERRPRIAGNIYMKSIGAINVHKYSAHLENIIL